METIGWKARPNRRSAMAWRNPPAREQARDTKPGSPPSAKPASSTARRPPRAKAFRT
jgi:hypothetical protein